MNEQQQEFAEELGIAFEALGTSPMLGRVLGALMVSAGEDMTAQDLATGLSASRGAISQATRQLVELGMVRRFRRSGDRKDYFRVLPDAWWISGRRKIQEARYFRELFSRGLDLIPNGSPPGASVALEEAIDFLEFWETKSAEYYAEWEQGRARRRGLRHSDTPPHQDVSGKPRNS